MDEVNEDSWLGHIYHLSMGHEFIKTCSICQIVDNRESHEIKQRARDKRRRARERLSRRKLRKAEHGE